MEPKLEVIRYLDNDNSLNDLSNKFNIEINTKEFNNEQLHILNYNHIDKENKYNEIANNCRGLVIRKTDYGWSVVARGFNRFFNIGENPENDSKFNWENFIVEEKIDGSLIFLYFCPIRNKWCVNTRNSFSDGKPNNCCYTWEELFYLALPNKNNIERLNKYITYVFELGTPYTQIVKFFEKPTLYLLTCCWTDSIGETSDEYRNWVASEDCLNIKVPEKYEISSLQEILNFLNNEETKYDFEGFVIRDYLNSRIKIKNKKYLAVHYAKGNNNIFLFKNLLPMVLSETDEIDELCSYFGGLKEKVEKIKIKINQEKEKIQEKYDEFKYIENQKDFALKVKDLSFAPILFETRKLGFYDINCVFKSNVGLKYLLRTIED